MADNDPTLSTLVAELAASKQPITAVGIDGKVTLRQAIATVYWKSASLLTLGGRPRDPKQADDQYGHVLSLRAETLINQALLAAVINHLNKTAGANIDIAAIRSDVIRSLS